MEPQTNAMRHGRKARAIGPRLWALLAFGVIAALPSMGFAQTAADNLYNASYAGGGFAHLTGKTWVENTATGTVEWREYLRDEWSVYISSGGKRVALDLHQMKIHQDAGSGWQVLRSIQKQVRYQSNGASLRTISSTGSTTGCKTVTKKSELDRDVQDFGGFGLGEFTVKCPGGKPELGGRLFSLVTLFGSTFEVGELRGYVRDGEAGVELFNDGWRLASYKLVGTGAVDGPLTVAEPLYKLSKKKRFVYGGLNFDITASAAVVAGARDVRPVLVKTGVGTVAGFSGEAYLNASAGLSAYVASIFASAGVEATITLAELALPASFAGIANGNGGMDGPYGDLDLRVEVMSNGRLKARAYVMGFSTTLFNIDVPTLFRETYLLI